MEMFLMIAVMSLLGVGVSALAFAAATRSPAEPPQRPAEKPVLSASRFFADERSPAPGEAEVAAIVLQIEQHVRLEQAAAEAFLRVPTAESLHSRTASRLGN
jgi:hypothetical protein